MTPALRRLAPLALAAALLGGCSHQIAISPLDAPARAATLNPKHVAYVMTDADRAQQVHTAGGGGDKVNYFPYRDLEKAIRDALRAVYDDVVVVRSTQDAAAIQAHNVAFVFKPTITTSSSSDSLLTWPPTQFSIRLECVATSPDGKEIARFSVSGEGRAEFSEFKNDLGLAGRRAASDLSEKLRQAVQAHAALH